MMRLPRVLILYLPLIGQYRLEIVNIVRIYNQGKTDHLNKTIRIKVGLQKLSQISVEALWFEEKSPGQESTLIIVQLVKLVK